MRAALLRSLHIRLRFRSSAPLARRCSMTAAAPALPEATCVHCGARFSTERLDYAVRAALLPADVASAFVPLSRDEETTAFLLDCASRGTATRLAQSAAAAAVRFGELEDLSFSDPRLQLRARLSLTDANALVGRGSMHVLSTAQARLLLRADGPPAGVLLDVGAGDGGVTSRLAPLFEHVVATEVSAPMVRRLRGRGFAAALHTAEVSAGGLAAAAAAEGGALPAVQEALAGGFDCVALLNVLDRCDAPLTLLRQLRALLRPGGGRLLLAVVLPFRPFVEEGTQRKPPTEALGLPPDASFELSLSRLWAVLRPLGFVLEAVARAPYLSDGDTNSPVYSLDDAVLVLRADDAVQ